MAIETISIMLAKAAASYAFKRMASKGAEGIIDWIKEEANRNEQQLTDKDLETLSGLLEGNNTLFKALFARVVPYTFSGVVCAGPSGAGKTSIQNFFSENRLVPPTESTYKIHPNAVRYEAWTYQITDTIGQIGASELRAETFSTIQYGKEKILMLVFAAGFLKTLGVVDENGSEIKYKRPSGNAQATFEEYLSAAVNEEIEWLNSFMRAVSSRQTERFRYVMVVVNKLDQWYAYREQVAKFYEGKLNSTDDARNINPFTKHLNFERSQRFNTILSRIVDNLCIQGIRPTYHYVASQYDSLYENAPSGEMSNEAVELSVRLLRAQVRVRFLE